MRSTTSTSLALALLAGPLAAQAGPPPGCWERVYSDDHIAAQPDQVVRWLQIHILDVAGQRNANLRATFLPRGHARAAGIARETMLDQSLFCWQSGAEAGCAVDCDGGSFRVVRETADAITVETEYLMVGDTEGCGGAVDLSEGPGRATRYRLNAAPLQSCLEP